MNRKQAIVRVNQMLGFAFIGKNISYNSSIADSIRTCYDEGVERPDTYFLQEAVNRGLAAISNRLDRKEKFRPFFEIQLSPTPYLEHQIWDLGDMCARFTDAFMLGRQVTGCKEYQEEERALRKLLLESDPYANPFMAGRMLITFVDEYFQNPVLENTKKIDDLIKVIFSKMTIEGDYAYYFKNAPDWKTMKNAVFGDFNGYPTFPIGGIILALARYTESVATAEGEDLLDRLCRFVIYVSGTFEPDGRYQGHTHSGGILTAATGVMRWAIRRNDKKVIDQMKNAFDWTLKHSSTWGWVPDGLGPNNASCETCSVTDAVHLGLLIARHIDPAYYGIIERFFRNQLLENQIEYPERLLPKTNFPDKTKISNALHGSWASWSLPNSLDNCLDVEGCCLGSGIRGCFLVWDHIITRDNNKVMVNMALSRNSPWLEVIGFQPYAGRLDLIVHDAPLVYVRVPDWVSENEITVRTDNGNHPFNMMADHYISIQGLKRGSRVRIEYPLRQEESVELVSGNTYHVLWRGDTVISVSPAGQKYPLYERTWMKKQKTPMIADDPYQKQLGGPIYW